jgi:hypothetical protein
MKKTNGRKVEMKTANARTPVQRSSAPKVSAPTKTGPKAPSGDRKVRTDPEGLATMDRPTSNGNDWNATQPRTSTVPKGVATPPVAKDAKEAKGVKRIKAPSAKPNDPTTDEVNETVDEMTDVHDAEKQHIERVAEELNDEAEGRIVP